MSLNSHINEEISNQVKLQNDFKFRAFHFRHLFSYLFWVNMTCCTCHTYYMCLAAWVNYSIKNSGKNIFRFLYKHVRIFKEREFIFVSRTSFNQKLHKIDTITLQKIISHIFKPK